MCISGDTVCAAGAGGADVRERGGVRVRSRPPPPAAAAAAAPPRAPRTPRTPRTPLRVLVFMYILQ